MYCVLVSDYIDKMIEIEEYDLSQWSFFARSGIKECIRFSVCELYRYIVPTHYQNFRYQPKNTETTFYIYCYSNNRKCIFIFIDDKYEPRVVLNALQELSDVMCNDILKEECKRILKEYNDPDKIDKIDKIGYLRNDVDKTKQILVEDINKLLERDESIERLIERTNELSYTGKVFVKKSKELNRCCSII